MSASEAYEDAAAALQTARLQVEEEMQAAKEAHRKNPSKESKAAKDKAVASLQQVRAMERQGRPTQVAGDVFPTPADELIIDVGSDNGPGPVPTEYGRTLADQQPPADDNGEGA